MKQRFLGLLALVFLAGPCGAADLPPAPAAAARLLLEGVGPLNFDGAPGRLALYGPHLFPLLQDSQGRDAAAVYDDGRSRAVILTHDFWFQAMDRTRGSERQLVGNAVAWLAGAKQGARVLCFGTLDLGSQLESRGYRVDSPDRFPTDLKPYAAVFVSLPNEWSPAFDRSSARVLRAAFQARTPVLAMGMGWVWRDFGEGTKGGDLGKDYPGNAVFGEAGFLFTQDTTEPALQPPVLEGRALRNRVLWAQALGALDGRTDGLEPGFPARLFDAFEVLPDWHLVLSDPDLKALARRLSSLGSSIVGTEDRPVPMTDLRSRTASVMAELMSRRHPELFRSLYPWIGEFPGNGTDWTKEPRRLVTNLAVSRTSGGAWQTTGVYARAGETLSVQVKGLAPGDRVRIQVGAHQDVLEFTSQEPPEFDQLPRWPWATQEFALADGRVTFLSRLSGPVYVVVPEGGRNDLGVTVEGGMSMPVFRPGTDPRTFLAEVRASACPLVEVGGRFMAFTQPRDTLPPDFDPVRVTAWWDRAAVLASGLLGQAPGPQAQRYVADRQIALGYMHSGYPIMTFLDVAGFQMGGPGSNGEDLYRDGSWGHFHELGHNLQAEAWTFSNAGEVTCNLFSLYLMDKLVGIRPLAHPALTEHAEAVRAYLAHPDWAHWSDDPFVALQTYAVLIDRYGWEPFTRTFRAYAALAEDQRPQTDQEKVDRWVLEFSRQAGTNLAPYFRRWGWPVGEDPARALAALPAWTGDL